MAYTCSSTSSARGLKSSWEIQVDLDGAVDGHSFEYPLG